MKKTMTRILLLCAALVLAMSLCLVAHAEEEAAEISTPAYIFWQDSDWWPAVSNNTDDYWTPTPANVTGEGYYTVSVQAHMPSWFYSGGNHNTGAQKLAVVITDGATLFPEMYMQIIDIRVDGVSYACGDVTYGQTGYDNIAEDGTVFWKANDSYGLIYDQWMIDNAGTMEGAKTWSSSGTAQKFDVFDVSVLNDPSTIEIDFFLSSQQDVKPEGGPELRVLSEGPSVHGEVVALSGLSDIQTQAWLYFCDASWWPSHDNAESGNGFKMSNAEVTGQGSYTVGFDLEWAKDWQTGLINPDNAANGVVNASIIIENGENLLPDHYVQITDVRVDGTSVAFNNNVAMPWTYDAADTSDTAVPLYSNWMSDGWLDSTHNDGNTVRRWEEDGSWKVLDPDTIVNASNIYIDFIVTDEAGAQPEIPVLSYDYQWYPNNTMGVAGYSLRDKGITNKWYNVAPVDLTKNGIYKIPMVASNMFIIGNAIVTVDGDNVTVDYETQWASPGNMTISDECVKWFASIEDVTDEFCQNPESDLAFGQTISKAGLGNTGYLFICNRVTYCQPIADNGIYLAPYNHNHVIWEAYRAGLDAMVAELGE